MIGLAVRGGARLVQRPQRQVRQFIRRHQPKRGMVYRIGRAGLREKA
jgi:hypothetical protein